MYEYLDTPEMQLIIKMKALMIDFVQMNKYNKKTTFL